MDSSRKRINVTSSSMPPLDEYMQEICELWDSRWLTNNGAKHRELESSLCNFLDVKNTSLFVNGHLALEAALNVLDLSGEVITTPYTYISTTQAIVRCGLTPVFCDIKPDDYTMDPEKLEDLITEKTSAILPVHVYGNICDNAEIMRIAKKYNLKVLYDAAHAFGMIVGNTGVGNLGDLSMFSFHATKVFHTIEGGAITSNNADYSKHLKAWRQFGMYDKEDAEIIGTNAKMNEFQAAMGLCNLRHVKEEIAKRKAAVLRYKEILADIPGLSLCPEENGICYNYAYFPVIIHPELFGKTRDQVFEELALNNIGARKYFYPLTSSFTAYQGKFPIQETPIAARVAEQVLTLPLYADLHSDDIDRICKIVLEGV